MKKLLLASVLAIASFPGYATEAFDWEKYCGDDYGCDDRGDRGVGKFFEPPSQAELRACSKNGKLDYACLRDSYWGKLTDYKICFREEGGKLDSGDWPQCDPGILGAIERQCVQDNFGPNKTLGFQEQWASYHRCVDASKVTERNAKRGCAKYEKDAAGFERCIAEFEGNPDEPKPPARVTVTPTYQGPSPIGWVYGPYTQCANPPQCSMGVVNVQADGLNVRTVPNGPPVMSLVNGTVFYPLQRQGDWLLVAPACDLTPTWAWSWNAGVPLNRCWVYF
jgi:hypothetical protein